MTESTISFSDLTFVTRNLDGTHNFWTPERPEVYAAGCAMGREYAAELHTFMQVTDDASIFGTVLRAIARGGEWSAVEIGFCGFFGIKLLGIDRSAPTPQVVEPEGVAA